MNLIKTFGSNLSLQFFIQITIKKLFLEDKGKSFLFFFFVKFYDGWLSWKLLIKTLALKHFWTLKRKNFFVLEFRDGKSFNGFLHSKVSFVDFFFFDGGLIGMDTWWSRSGTLFEMLECYCKGEGLGCFKNRILGCFFASKVSSSNPSDRFYAISEPSIWKICKYKIEIMEW
jgi:hypothetical protein